MDTIKALFRKSHYFWIVTKTFYILVFIIVLTRQNNYFDTGTNSELIASIYSFVYIISLTWILISEFFKRITVPKIVNYFVGGSTIIFGLVLTFLIFYSGYEKYGLSIFAFQLVPLWIILLGIRDILLTKTVANTT